MCMKPPYGEEGRSCARSRHMAAFLVRRGVGEGASERAPVRAAGNGGDAGEESARERAPRPVTHAQGGVRVHELYGQCW